LAWLYDIRPTTTLFASYMEGLKPAPRPSQCANMNVILPSAISHQREIGIRDSYFEGSFRQRVIFRIQRAMP